MTNAFQDLSNGITEIIEAASPSVVRVEGRRRLSSSGVVWSGEGVIVTAHHTLERDENINIGLQDGRVIPATMIGRDPRTDLAVLRVEEALPTATWGNAATLKVGHLALALGRPGADVQASLGLIRAIHENGFGGGRSRRGGDPAKKGAGRGRGGRNGEGERGRGGRNGEGERGRGGRRHHHGHHGPAFSPIIHADIVLYPGFSGGPLLDGTGAVQGINTSGLFRAKNMLVPTNAVNSVVEALLAHGRIRRAYLGVGVQPVRITPSQHDLAGQEAGLMVVSIEAESPAEKAGLLQGDILLSLNDTSLQRVDDLLLALSNDIDNTVSLKLVRGGQIHSLNVTVGERA